MLVLRKKLAQWLAREQYDTLQKSTIALAKAQGEIDTTVNQRVADVLAKMDPFEPLLKKYNLIFSKEYERIEDKLDEASQFRLFMWAYGIRDSVEFKHITSWIQNTQGNLTVRKAAGDHQWFFGRAMVASISLFIEETSRLASRYEDIVTKKDLSFNQHLPVEE